MLVEAAWVSIRSPGPLRAFGERVRACRGAQIAAVAVARKLVALCWHLLTKGSGLRVRAPIADPTEDPPPGTPRRRPAIGAPSRRAARQHQSPPLKMRTPSRRRGLSPTAGTANGAPTLDGLKDGGGKKQTHVEMLCALVVWRQHLDDAGRDPRDEIAFQHTLIDYGQILRQEGGSITQAWTPGAAPREWRQ